MALRIVNVDRAPVANRLGRKSSPRVPADEVPFDCDAACFDPAEELVETTAAARAKKTNNATIWPRVIIFRIWASVVNADVKGTRRVFFIEGKLPFESRDCLNFLKSKCF
jgi:hypothetical protein